MLRALRKTLMVLILFALCLGGVLVFAYDYFYEYPIGKLDTLERADDARYYKLIYSDKADKDTTVYFTRSNNGVGTDVHFGTLDSNMPDFIANFFCTPTSSTYVVTDGLAYIVADDGVAYLFGVTTDENTVSLEVTFNITDQDSKTVEMEVVDHCYYLAGFDTDLAQYDFSITGYNADGYATFIYDYYPFEGQGINAETL